MPDRMQTVYDLPDVSFTGDDTLEAMLERLVNHYESQYQRLTNRPISLAPADPMRILMHSIALELFMIEQFVERAGKQDLLKYSYGAFLDNLAANRGVTRKQPAPALTTLRFTISEKKAYAVGIPAGTRATNGEGIYFETTEYGEVRPGSLFVDIDARCTENGIQGNDFMPGQIAFMVDRVAYVSAVSNQTVTSGGTDLESDESLAERAYMAPSSYSVAGPEDAYVYWTKTYNPEIGSVKPTSPSPCMVDVYILMGDGSIPKQEVVDGLQEYLMDGNIRPLTDLVTVKTPTVKPFTVDITYYINRSDSAAAATIQQEVSKAVAEYITWQTTEIGKDINPSELIKRVVAAGAKRVNVNSPTFITVSETAIGQCTGQTVNYGGLEDD